MKPSTNPSSRRRSKSTGATGRNTVIDSQVTVPGSEPGDGDAPDKPHLSVNLFWRTYLLLSLLLLGSILAWLLAVERLEQPTRAEQAGQHIASLVNLTRTALRYADASQREAVVKTLHDEERTQILARGDEAWTPWAQSRYTRLVVEELRGQLGDETLVASAVNGQPALWVSFSVDGRNFWLQTDPERLAPKPDGTTWLLWLGLAFLATLGGAAGVAKLINRPLQELSFAASKVQEGDYESTLNETNITTEIRAVNIGFNRMAQKLAKVEEERAVMLAGISHDLRTPLARLRLEAEISVSDDEARKNMALDIDQLDAIIDKFMDYARPEGAKTVPVELSGVVEREANSFRNQSQIRFSLRLPPALRVMGDDTELGRVFANLFENSRRYGRTAETGVAKVRVSHVIAADTVIITVRDFGPGVPHEKLSQLTTPFFRGDAARTAANGAGLGLAIVQKALQRIGGSLELANARDGGLMAHIRLKRA